MIQQGAEAGEGVGGANPVVKATRILIPRAALKASIVFVINLVCIFGILAVTTVVNPLVSYWILFPLVLIPNMGFFFYLRYVVRRGALPMWLEAAPEGLYEWPRAEANEQMLKETGLAGRRLIDWENVEHVKENADKGRDGALQLIIRLRGSSQILQVNNKDIDLQDYRRLVDVLLSKLQ